MEADKQRLRARLRGERRALSPDDVGRLSGLVCSYAQELAHFQHAASLGLYLSIDNEVNPASLLFSALRSEKAVFLPVVDKVQRCLRFVRYRWHDPLVVGAFGMREPLLVSGAACVDAGDLDILFLPLVAFDPSGWRLGYGGGFYDRALIKKKHRVADVKPLLVGLAYHFQEVASLPHGAHDVPMDGVVTDRGGMDLSV